MKKRLMLPMILLLLCALLLAPASTALGDVLTGTVGTFSIPDDPVEPEPTDDTATFDDTPTSFAQADASAQPVVLTEPVPITVGVSTQMSGYFFSDMWGNNTVDADIRSMLHGYGTIVWKNAGEYGVDANVVTDLSTTDGNRGRTYTITLADDLTYSDGTPITAADYVFTILLQRDPLIPQLGGMNTNFAHLIGWSDYAAGQANAFAGVRLLSDTSFSVTVPARAIPYFYELTYVAVEPCPIRVLAPDYRVMDDGDGAYLAYPDAAAEGSYVRTALTLELLQATLTAEDGYLHQPKLTCGPYMLTSWLIVVETPSLWGMCNI